MSQTSMVRKAILKILASLKTDYARKVHHMLQCGDDLGVSALRVDPHEYRESSQFAADYLAANIARKWTGLETGLDTESVARLGFLEQEARNAEYNSGLITPQYPDLRPHIEAQATFVNTVIQAASKRICDILGDFDAIEFSRSCSFSSGASYSLRRKFGDQAFKYVHGELEVTSEAEPLARLMIETSPRWNSTGVTLKKVAGARFATVPKDSTKDRCINIEPRMNTYLQKGIGSMIRSRLRKKCGIDLSDQGVNKHLAYLGSVRNEFNLATIDLSAASDSITSRLVMDLLPSTWFRILYAVRSHRVEMPDGSLHNLEMMSGMGNGFTFELETLIFWAIARSAIEINGSVKDARDKTCRVYGDDIVVPSRHYESVVCALSHCGFTVNSRKSFYHGGFRESCGGHYFLGRDVTPFYVENASDCSVDLIHIANAYHLWCKRNTEHASQAVFDYVANLAQKFARGKMTSVPPREGLKAGLIWSEPAVTEDREHAAIRKRCRKLPRFSTILVDNMGNASVQDNDWNNIGLSYRYVRFSYAADADQTLPESGRYLSALQTLQQGPCAELPFESSLKGKIKSRSVKTSTWCSFEPYFTVPTAFAMNA